MKRLLMAVGLVAVWCWYQRRHNAKRQPVGGLRCEDCKRALADMSEATRGEEASVDPGRRIGPRGHELDDRFRRAGQ